MVVVLVVVVAASAAKVVVIIGIRGGQGFEHHFNGSSAASTL